MENDLTEARKNSRRYKIIKLFAVLIIFCIGYPSVMIPLFPAVFKDYITFYLTTAGTLIAVVGTWVGFVSAMSRKRSYWQSTWLQLAGRPMRPWGCGNC